MAISQIKNPISVLRALEEYEKLGREEFHKKNGFSDSTKYFLFYNNNHYPSKAILGVAYSYEYPGKTLTATDFSGGKSVESKLRELGFQIRVKDLKDKIEEVGEDIVEQVEVTTFAFKRSQEVVERTLLKAKGICERCDNPAPFRRPDGNPYLEVHHLVQLNKGGSDKLHNTLALCPNCHREMHHGAISAEEFLRLKSKIEKREGLI